LALGSTYTSLTYHVIFSTKNRKPMLRDAIRDETYRYIAGIIANKEGRLVEIGGVEDHVHLLTSCSPRMALADFIRDIKSNSSRWLHEEGRHADFGWQTGYAAFTVSQSQISAVQDYIRGQAEHHRQRSFEEEFRAILVRHGIQFDERFLFDGEHVG
jgi:REP element-mobilizing transposase RayT